jgi:hypothetical protein
VEEILPQGLRVSTRITFSRLTIFVAGLKVLTKLRESGVDQTALHKHVLQESARVMSTHIRRWVTGEDRPGDSRCARTN